METIEAICQQIETLYQEHRDAPFPRQCYENEQVNGTSLVGLDAALAGCISTFLARGYTLDLWRTATLGQCYRSVALVLPYLPEEEARSYYARLETLAGLVLQVVARKAKEAEDT